MFGQVELLTCDPPRGSQLMELMLVEALVENTLISTWGCKGVP